MSTAPRYASPTPGARWVPDLVDGLDVVDDLAAVLVAAEGDPVAQRELAERYASDHRIRPAG